MQRDLLKQNIESLALRKEAGTITEQQYAAEMDQLNGMATAIAFASKQLDDQAKAELQATAASMTATNQAQDLEGANQDLGQQVELTGDEIEKLAKTMEKAYQDGAKAVDTYVDAAIKFNTDLTAAIKSGNAEQAQAVAANYAEQAAAAKASMGDQLATYTVAQRQLGNISEEQAGMILGAISKEFGSTQSIAAETFLKMEGSIDSFAQSGSQDADALGARLGALANYSVELKEKMEALKGKYEAELIDNFKQGKIDADELRAELEKIPAKVYSEVTITTEYKTIGEPPQGGGSTVHGNAKGGPVKKGVPTIVGEKGPELFWPSANGSIIPNHRLPVASAGQIMMPQPQIIIMQPANTTNYNGQVGNNYTTQRGGGLSFDHMAALWGGRG